MINIRNVKISTVGKYLTTDGLTDIIGYEVYLLIREHEELRYINLLSCLIDYFIDSKSIIKTEQTIAYHSWLLKFVGIEANRISIYEVLHDGGGFVEGADHAISVMREQDEQCIKLGVTPLYPTFSQMIVVSKGVLEGKRVDAVRYPSPNHMTGWWLTTELYNGNVDSLETIHYYHVAFKRPDITKLLALPFGFRFASDEESEVWFDNEVLS